MASGDGLGDEYKKCTSPVTAIPYLILLIVIALSLLLSLLVLLEIVSLKWSHNYDVGLLLLTTGTASSTNIYMIYIH